MDKPKTKLVPHDLGIRRGTAKLLTFEQTVKYMRLNFNRTNNTLTHIK